MRKLLKQHKHLIFLVLFILIPLLTYPSVSHAETDKANGCRLSAWWDNDNRCIQVVAECSLDIEGNEKILLDTKSVDVEVTAVPLDGNKGVRKPVKVNLNKNLISDDKTFFKKSGTFNPKNVEPGDEFDFRAKFTDQKDRTIADLKVNNVRWNTDTPPPEQERSYLILEVKYKDKDVDNRFGSILINAKNLRPPKDRSSLQLYWSVDGGKENLIDNPGYFEYRNFKFVPPNPKDGQAYTITAKNISGKDVLDQKSETVTWGNLEPTPSDESNNQAEDTNAPPTVDKGGMFERIIAEIVSVPCNLIEGLFNWGGFKPLDKLVFLQGYTDEEKKNLPWEGNEPKYVRLWFQTLAFVTAPFMVLVIAASAFKLIYAAANPAARSEAMESFQRALLSVFIVALAPVMVSTLMWICSLLVGAISGGFQDVATAVGMGRAVGDWGAINVGGMQIVTGSVLGTAIVRLFMTGMFGYINALYIVRKVALTVFYCFTPIAAMLWVVNKNSNAMLILIGEMASNAFMPVAHALVLCTILLFCNVKEMSNGTWLTILISLYTLIPLAEAIRNSLQSVFVRWAGMNEEATAIKAMGAVMGFGGVVSMARVGKAAFGDSRIPLPGKIGGTSPAGPNPGRQIGFRPPQPATPTPGSSGPEIGSVAPPLYGQSASSGYTLFGSGSSSEQHTGAVQPLSRFNLPPRVATAVKVGSMTGRAAALGAGVLSGMALSAIPGGDRMVQPIAAATKGIAGAAAGGMYLAASYVTWKAGVKISQAAQEGSPLAQKAVQVGRNVQSAGHLVAQKLGFGTQQISDVRPVQQIGFRPPNVAVSRAKYPASSPGGLDGIKER